jgi:hypothetical protein
MTYLFPGVGTQPKWQCGFPLLRISHYLADFCHFIHKTTGEFG